MRLWSIWEASLGEVQSARLVRVAWNNPGWSLGWWGNDLVKVDAISTAGTFGRFWGPSQGRVQFHSIEAAEEYRDLTVEGALDLIREAVLSAEVEWNVQAAKTKNGRPDRMLLAYNSGPDVQAASYGWRETYTKSLNCIKCLWRTMKVMSSSPRPHFESLKCRSLPRPSPLSALDTGCRDLCPQRNVQRPFAPG